MNCIVTMSDSYFMFQLLKKNEKSPEKFFIHEGVSCFTTESVIILIH